VGVRKGNYVKTRSQTIPAQVGDAVITIETGKLALQAGGAVTVRLGDSIVFAAATMGGVREGTDFFPLTVDYEERMYAGGRIPAHSPPRRPPD
jgi:polyribonucleotide nucleotidyltransferase